MARPLPTPTAIFEDQHWRGGGDARSRVLRPRCGLTAAGGRTADACRPERERDQRAPILGYPVSGPSARARPSPSDARARGAFQRTPRTRTTLAMEGAPAAHTAESLPSRHDDAGSRRRVRSRWGAFKQSQQSHRSHHFGSPDRAETSTHTLAFQVTFVDLGGDVLHGTRNIATNLGPVSIPITVVGPGISPTATTEP